MLHLSSYVVNYFPLLLAILCSFFGAHATVPSPRASTELICHTNRASDCYPSIFQPTEEFQVVKDDQSLPPGLHVRMNLATGVKEARLNVQEPEDVHSDLVIVEKSEQEDTGILTDHVVDDPFEEDHIPVLHEQSVLSPPRVQSPAFEAGEASIFEESMSQLRDSPSNQSFDPTPALIALQDLCHSGDWGLRLTKDSNVTRLLVQSLQDVSQKVAVRSGAALLLAIAIQNNPEALTAALSHFYNDEWPTGPLDAVLLALLHDHSVKLLIRTVFLLSTLSQDQDQLLRFVNAGGLEILLKVFQDETLNQPDHVKLRGKIANFIYDHIATNDWSVLSAQQPFVSEAGKKAESLVDVEDDAWILVEKPQPRVDLGLIEKNLKDWNSALKEALSHLNNSESPSAFESLDNAQLALEQHASHEAS